MKSMNPPSSIIRSARAPRVAGLVMTLGLLSLGAVACGDDSDTDSGSAGTVASTDAAAEVVVSGQWARTSPADVANGAAYFTITSPVDDKLVGASVPTTVAAMTQIHETVMAGGMNTTMAGSPGGNTDPGQMTMQPVEFIELKAGVPVELKPGGYHIMMMGLVAPLKLGDTITLTLTLEKAGAIQVDVPVLDEAP